MLNRIRVETVPQNRKATKIKNSSWIHMQNIHLWNNPKEIVEYPELEQLQDKERACKRKVNEMCYQILFINNCHTKWKNKLNLQSTYTVALSNHGNHSCLLHSSSSSNPEPVPLTLLYFLAFSFSCSCSLPSPQAELWPEVTSCFFSRYILSFQSKGNN